jgi:hypothetical protein
MAGSSKLQDARPYFLQMANDFGWLNPHLSISAAWNGSRYADFEASDPSWRKWQPYYPTSPHWYDLARLRRLMGAYIGRDQDRGRVPRTVREFISEFRGLSGSAKQKLILDEVGAARLSLPELFCAGDEVNTDGIVKLLAAMQRWSKPVKPQDLGLIGKEHLAARFAAAGVDPRTFNYKRTLCDDDGLPAVVEVAFGYCPEGFPERRIITGVNWSVGINNPFRLLGHYAPSLDVYLQERRVGRDEPIVLIVHVAYPRVSYTDTGKGAVSLPDNITGEVVRALIAVTKGWTKQRKAEEKHASAVANRERRLIRASDYYNFKSAAYEVMEEAYLKASANVTLPAKARQIMYEARPFIQDKMNDQQLGDQYFCQTLLPDYIKEHGVAWNVVYDDRGHCTEPHTGLTIGLGTVSVRDYLAGIAPPKLVAPGFAAASIDTHGPEGCFGGVFFCEKEGFDALWEQVNIARRHDLAYMSCKGIWVTAARELADQMCAKYNIPLYLLTDFDKSGFVGAGHS